MSLKSYRSSDILILLRRKGIKVGRAQSRKSLEDTREEYFVLNTRDTAVNNTHKVPFFT